MDEPLPPRLTFRTRGSVSGSLRQTLSGCCGLRPLCNQRSPVPASRRRKSNPPPSAWRSLHPRGPTRGCGLFQAGCQKGGFWGMAWEAWLELKERIQVSKKRRNMFFIKQQKGVLNENSNRYGGGVDKSKSTYYDSKCTGACIS